MEMYTIAFIQCTIFLASYVYCARQPPSDFFEKYNEEKCIEVNHVMSHTNFRDRSAVSLDMICESDDVYDLASFARPQLYVIRTEKRSIRIVKAEHNVTVIKFKSTRKYYGLATVYFESVADAKNFNKNVYPPLKSNLKVLWKIGKIDKILTTEPYPVATQFADIYYERESDPIKFVIEADGIPEPALVFQQEEFELTIDERENSRKCILKLGGMTTYEISFETDEGRREFHEDIHKFIAQGPLPID